MVEHLTENQGIKVQFFLSTNHVSSIGRALDF